jgi:8-oxo-dGTP diphosphatase
VTGERLVVAAAIVHAGRVLSCRRTGPPALAGRWEFPGGKVESGEDEPSALRRECCEELELEIVVGARLGGDVVLGDVAVPGGSIRIRVYWATLATASEPVLHDHDEIRWLAPSALFDVHWIDADLGLVAELQRTLGG